MTITSIAKKNVKNNVKNYIMYLNSIIISVAIFFIFKSLEFNDTVNMALEGSTKLNIGFNAASIVLIFFSGLFIWYSNAFFLKKRKKEIALYSILGIENKKIGKILFLETFLIGIIALVTGILIGSLFSRIATIVLIKVINLDVHIGQVVTIKAIVNTVITFTIIFFIVSIISGSTIYKFELIDLLKAESKRENEPKVSVIKSVLSVLFIILGYLIYFGSTKSSNLELSVLMTLVLVVSGTFMLFSSFLVYLIKIKRKNENNYYKGLNMLIASKLLYRIKGNAKSLSLIAILTATTLTAMGVTMTYHNKFIGEVDKAYPYSYAVKSKDNNLNKDIIKILDEENNIEVIGNTNESIIELEVKIDDKSSYVNIISQNHFNKVNNLRKDKYTIEKLNSGECVYFNQYGNEKKDNYKSSNVDIQEVDMKFSIKGYYAENLINEYISIETIVLNNEDYNKIIKVGELYNLSIYQIKHNEDIKILDENIENIVNRSLENSENSNDMILVYSSYYKTFKNESSAIGGMLFIGIFIGMVFLAATGSIIFFKQVSEATEEINRYKTLKKIGIDDRDIKISVYKEMGYIFLGPLAIGIFHSTIAISLIANAFNQSVPLILFKILTPYILIYLGYYILTAKNYYNIVNNQ